MVAKTVSPRFVRLTAASLAGVICISLIYAPIRPIPVAENQAHLFFIRFWAIYFLSLFILVPTTLACLGIQVRRRSVEPLQAVDFADGREIDVDLPIRVIRQGSRLIRATSIALLLAGAICYLLACFHPPGISRAIAALGLILMTIGLIATQAQPVFVCEISEKGLRAPDGFWRRETFVPWAELAHCEIVRDDAMRGDYIVLWDRTGRRRFKASKEWLRRSSKAERTRILHALRSRFPQKATPDRDAKPAPAGAAWSAVWDRELDG